MLQLISQMNAGGSFVLYKGIVIDGNAELILCHLFSFQGQVFSFCQVPHQQGKEEEPHHELDPGRKKIDIENGIKKITERELAFESQPESSNYSRN